MKCMDCGEDFEGDPGPPPDRRCGLCALTVRKALEQMPEAERQRAISRALERAMRAGAQIR